MNFGHIMWPKKTIFFLLLFISYLAYSAWVYTDGTEAKNGPMSSRQQAGKQLWHQYNCVSCHQVYGLGGYLGPDLTQIISDPRRGRLYAAAFLRSGGTTMPNFKFTEAEVKALLDYLSYVDASTKNQQINEQ